jgi:WbqC-like protein family
MTVVAMHQPTFLPWLGWFDKLARADMLVLLDDVQFPKKGGTWLNRVRILVQGRAAWLTMPVDRAYHGFRKVREARIDDSGVWRAKALKTIASSYARASYFDEIYPVVEEIFAFPSGQLAAFNEAGIRRLAGGLELDAMKLVHQSDIDVSGQGTDLLISLCKALGATAYLSGDGAGGYLVPDRFVEAGVQLVEQRFKTPKYPQASDEFQPGLSTIDALMSCGWRVTADLLRQASSRRS